MIYSGIGSRETPPEYIKQMTSVGRFMASWGHTLRSGAAAGADTAFEIGCDEQEGTKEVYLPYERFRGHQSSLFGSTREARMIAKEFHPNWAGLGDTGRAFMTRNVYQVLGQDLKTPTHFVICWTPNGKVTGGTGQALRIALHHEIPIFNLGSMTLSEINDGIQGIVG